MKRSIFAVLLAVVLLLCLASCSAPSLPKIAQTASPASPAPESEPVVSSTSELAPEPATTLAYVKAESINAVAGTLSRNDTVNIVRTEDEFYVVQDADGEQYLVEKKYIRTTEPMGTQMSYYTAADTPVYRTAYLSGEPETTLASNSQFAVSDTLNGIAYGSYQGESGSGTGYVDLSCLSETEQSLWHDIDGYICVDKVGIYDNPELSGTPITETVIKVHVHVYEQVGKSLHIKIIDTSVPTYNVEGYIPIEAFTDKTPNFGWGTYDAGGSGGSGGGSSGGGGGGGPVYGGDIVLAYKVVEEPRIVLLAGVTADGSTPVAAGTPGTSFSDGVELIVASYKKGDSVNLVAKDTNKYWTVLANHKICQIPAGSVQLEGEPEVEEEVAQTETLSMDGFICKDKVGIYDNPELSGEPIEMTVIRLQVHVSEKVKDAYHIEVTDTSVPIKGTTGFISIDAFSTEWPGLGWDGYYGDGGGGGGGSSGGGDPGGGSDWSITVY